MRPPSPALAPVLLVALLAGACSGSTSDGGEGEATGAPTATLDRVEMAAGDEATVDVLANDADPEGGALTVRSVGAPAGVTAEVADDGTVSVVPAAGTEGVVELTYQVVDESGEVATGTIEVDVGDTTGAEETAIAWGTCTVDDEDPTVRAGLEAQLAERRCATVDVPLDHEDPGRGTLELLVARRPALEGPSLGPLFVNQGGPGMEAVRFSVGFDQNPALDRFEVIGMDPRGTGGSERLACPSGTVDLGPSVVPEPGAPTTAFEEAAAAHAAACGDDRIAPFLGSNQVAADMDRIRALLGADQLTYFGASYGSDLGVAYLSRYPERVRAAVLDGATDLRLDLPAYLALQNRAVRARVDRLVDHCRAVGCAWAGDDDPAEAWTSLLDDLRAVPVVDEATGLTVTAASLVEWVSDNVGEGDEDLVEVLDALVVEGDAAELDPGEAPEWMLEVLTTFVAVTCADSPVDDYRAAAARLLEEGPDPGASSLQTLAACAAWPHADPIAVGDAAGAGPILVAATTGDVPTPYTSGVGMAEHLGASLVRWEADLHTAYFFSRCVGGHVDALLVDLEAPPDDATCEDAPTFWVVRDPVEAPDLGDLAAA